MKKDEIKRKLGNGREALSPLPVRRMKWLGLLLLAVASSVSLVVWLVRRPDTSVPSGSAMERSSIAKKELPYQKGVLKTGDGVLSRTPALLRFSDRPKEPVDGAKALDLILGPGQDDGRLRLREITKLPLDLSASECLRLKEFLLSKEKLQSVSSQEYYLMKNNILNRLVDQKNLSFSFVDVLTSMAFDPDHPPAIRNYAIQHLGVRFPKFYRNRDRNEASRSEYRKAVEGLFQALDASDPQVCAAAILSLVRERQCLSPEETARLGQRLVIFARNSHKDHRIRASALRAAAGFGLREILPDAKKWVRSPMHPTLRGAAAYVLGLLGGEPERAELLKMSNDVKEHKMVRFNAEKALQELDRRLGASRLNLRIFPEPSSGREAGISTPNPVNT